MSWRRGEHEACIVRSIETLIQAAAIRAIVYAGEQHCPLTEEFDGNDFAGATHLIVTRRGEPQGTLRLRWFADFAKVERVAVLADARDGDAARLLIRAAVDLAARKGYRRLIGHVESALIPYWKRALGVRVREGRPRFRFSDRDYAEIELLLPARANAITPDTDALVLLRPEGHWDEPGVLDTSSARGKPLERAWER